MAVGEVLVAALVAVPVDDAFESFTRGIDRWWQRDRPSPDAIVQFEGDRLVAVTPRGVQLLAEIERWTPPSLVSLRWSGPPAKPGDRVIIEFSPEGNSTRVVVRHQRSGMVPQDVEAAVIGLWWGDIVSRATAGKAPLR